MPDAPRPAGAGSLNLLLQEALTPYREGAPERRYGGRVFRVGDKVTQLRNNYDKGAVGVFNGTTGVVTGMSLEDHSLTVRTDEDEELAYDFDELDELAHAYAVTIHRSQGSEYPAVVIPLTTSAWMMLQRNLLYTGSRARRSSSSSRAHAARSPRRYARRAPAAATRRWRTASRPAESRHYPANDAYRSPERCSHASHVLHTFFQITTEWRTWIVAGPRRQALLGGSLAAAVPAIAGGSQRSPPRPQLLTCMSPAPE